MYLSVCWDNLRMTEQILMKLSLWDRIFFQGYYCFIFNPLKKRIDLEFWFCYVNVINLWVTLVILMRKQFYYIIAILHV